jgi:hypothetical protein
MKPSFNADLYAVAATVIPVLFLALAVQGSTFDAMLRWLNGAVVRKEGRLARLIESHTRLLWIRRIPRRLGVRAVLFSVDLLAFAVVFALLIPLVGSLLGEVFAVLALYHRHSSSWQDLWILFSVIALASVIALVPVWKLVTAFFGFASIGRRDRRDREYAVQISSETRAGLPFTIADYRFQFSKQKTRKDAERYAEMAIEVLQSIPLEQLRPGSPTADDIRQALDEAFPISDIAKLRGIAEKWYARDESQTQP